MMFLKSIRWRLPLTYAGIALLTALTLSGLLLGTLRTYYRERERRYLADNAAFIGVQLSPLLVRGVPPAALRTEIQGFAFLLQSRIRLLDGERNVVIDSGIPSDFYVDLIMAEPHTPAGADEAEQGGDAAYLVIRRQRVGSPPRPTPPPPPGPPTGSSGQSETTAGIPVALPPIAIPALPAISSIYGFGLGVETRPGRRSPHLVVVPIVNPSETRLAGYLELSAGPAFGSEILEGVAVSAAAASVLAVMLAVGVGWGASRRLTAPVMSLTRITTRMAAGDLAARASVTRQDEIGVLAHAFNTMADRVEETVVVLQRFLADAAHELHTPLTALRANLELAADEEQGAQRRTFLGRAQATVAQLEALTDGLLALSRLAVGQGTRAHTMIDLAGLVEETSEVYASRAEQAELTFGVDVPAGPIMILGNPAQVQRALANILDNAIKFSPEGGTVHVRLEQDGDRVDVTVADTGIGIPADDLPQLFDRFYRGRNAGRYAGSGLGLAIVRAIMEQHGGQVLVEQTAGGTRFSLRWPRWTDPTVAEETAPY